MVNKPTQAGFYRFKLDDNWHIGRWSGVQPDRIFFEQTVFLLEELEDFVGPIDPRPDAPQSPAPDEVEQMAASIWCYQNLHDEDWISPKSAFEFAEEFINYRNARRKEARNAQ